MGDEDEGPYLAPGFHVRLTLVLRNGHVSEVLDEELLVLRPEIVLIARELLDLYPLELAVVVWELDLVLDELADEVDGVTVLDTDKGAVEALRQQRAGRVKVGGAHARLEEGKVLLAAVVGVADNELDEALGLVDEPVHGEEGPLVLDVEELR